MFIESGFRGGTLVPGRTHIAGKPLTAQPDQLSCYLGPHSVLQISQPQQLLHLWSAEYWEVISVAESDLGAYLCHWRWKPEACCDQERVKIGLIFWCFRDQRPWAKPMTCRNENLHTYSAVLENIYCVTHCALQCHYNKWISKPWRGWKDGVTEKRTHCGKSLDHHVYILLWLELLLETVFRYMEYTAIWGHVDIYGLCWQKGHSWVCAPATAYVACVANITIKSHVDVCELLCYMKPYWYPWTMMPPGPCRWE